MLIKKFLILPFSYCFWFGCFTVETLKTESIKKHERAMKLVYHDSPYFKRKAQFVQKVIFEPLDFKQNHY